MNEVPSKIGLKTCFLGGTSETASDEGIFYLQLPLKQRAKQPYYRF